jgi:transducin (beta)-like 1
LDASPYSSFSIRRGELVELLAKALLYSEVEAHWKADEISSCCKAPFSLLQDHVCSPVDKSDRSLLPVAATQSSRPILQNGGSDHGLSSSLKRKLKEKSPEPEKRDSKKRIR